MNFSVVGDQLRAMSRRIHEFGAALTDSWSALAGSVSERRFVVFVVLPLAVALAVSVPLLPQLGLAAALLVAVLAVYIGDRRWGVAVLLALWFVVPGVRRVLGYVTEQVANDPLSLLPFAATAGAALVELARASVPRSALLAAAAVAAGFAFGLPLGFAAAPLPAMFAFGAYVAGLAGAIVIGGTLGRDGATRVLFRAIVVLAPLLALYALWQRLFGLPAWDQEWLDVSDFWSVIVEGQGALRVFSTANSPGTLAPLLAAGLLAALALRRRPAVAIPLALLCGLALGLTYVRSAWIALAAAALVYIVVSRGRVLPAVAAFLVIAVATVAVLAPVAPAAREVVQRARTIAQASSDRSVNERRQLLAEQLPASLTRPLGHGVGSAGEPSRLRGETPLRAPDNGYLSLLYQLGPAGFLLVAMALFAAAGAAVRLAVEAPAEARATPIVAGARATRTGRDASASDVRELRTWALALLAFYAVQLTAQDTFYGAHGVVLGLLCGAALVSVPAGVDESARRPVSSHRRLPLAVRATLR